MFTKIMVATDGSDHAQRAVGVAAEMAQKYGAELVLVHVLLRGKLPDALTRIVKVEHLVDEPPPTKKVAGVPMWMTALTSGGDDSEERREAFAVGQQIVERAEKVIRQRGVHDVRTVVEDGGPADGILRCVEREKPDLIVMGRRGLGPIERLLQGSVSQKVNQLAGCTCITVK